LRRGFTAFGKAISANHGSRRPIGSREEITPNQKPSMRKSAVAIYQGISDRRAEGNPGIHLFWKTDRLPDQGVRADAS
jgi:hypothetical protein